MKKATGILIILIFLMAQFGRYTSYMYCRLESRLPDCDCEKILVTTDHEKIQFSDVVFSTKWEDQIVTELKDHSSFHFVKSTIPLHNFSEDAVQGFPSSCFHPPANS